MFLHVMRSDPKELEFRGNIGQDSRLVPHSYKKRAFKIPCQSLLVA
jgi:hypothetical protein